MPASMMGKSSFHQRVQQTPSFTLSGPRRSTGAVMWLPLSGCDPLWSESGGTSPHGRQVGGVTPGQVVDAALVPGRAIELLRQFEVVAVVDDRPDHGVTGRYQGVDGARGGGRGVDPGLGEERRGQAVERDRAARPDLG